MNETPGWDRRQHPRYPASAYRRQREESQPWYFKHIGKIIAGFYVFWALVIIALVVLAYKVWWS